MSTVGDAIATLQVDPTSTPPAGITEVFKLLDKLNDGNKERFASSTPSKGGNMWKCIKYALALTIVVTVLNLGPVQGLLNKMFKNSMVKIGVQAFVFFIVAVVLMKKSSACSSQSSATSQPAQPAQPAQAPQPTRPSTTQLPPL